MCAFFFQLLSKGNVFTTDAITATLMTATRSVYSWDVVVQVLLFAQLPNMYKEHCNSHHLPNGMEILLYFARDTKKKSESPITIQTPAL